MGQGKTGADETWTLIKCIGFLVIREYANRVWSKAFLIPQMGWSMDIVLAHIHIALRQRPL